MVLTQVGQVAMMTTDFAFIGRMGDEVLAAAALGGRIYLLSFTFGVGLLAPTALLAARAFGNNNRALVRRTLCMGLWLALLLSLPTMTLSLC